jgi:hypothetical protein
VLRLIGARGTSMLSYDYDAGILSEHIDFEHHLTIPQGIQAGNKASFP